jgi:hypothetical protein
VHKGEHLQLSTSDDGVHWQNTRRILAARPESTFDNWALVAPTLVRGDREWVLFYSAFGASPAEQAEMKKQVGPFALNAKKWGIFVAQDKRLIDANLGRAVADAPLSGKTP